MARSLRGAAALPMLLALVDTAGAEWTVVNLHPAGAISSRANGVFDGQQVGVADRRASLWSGTADSWVNLNPPPEVYFYNSEAKAVSGEQQIGLARPYAEFPHAAIWSGTAEGWVDLDPLDTYSEALGGSEGTQVGYASVNGILHASLWSGTAESWVDLHPAVPFAYSVATSASAGRQAGAVRTSNQWRAALWSGSAASWVDLHPSGAFHSSANAADGAQQAGYAQIGSSNHAALWTGSAESWVDLNPGSAASSEVFGMFAGQQAGFARFGGQDRAALWSGSAATWEDLHAELAPEFTSSVARGIWSDGSVLHVVGYGYNGVSGREEALLWSRQIPEPGIGGLLLALAALRMVRRSRVNQNPAGCHDRVRTHGRVGYNLPMPSNATRTRVS